ncbi:CAP domain-containing protein [Subsaxibacter sp. CAU 1640]|uniref:CAP domain-containing protein n=1 Tax=Subsaxibacter sp. CAU 1640 TaxID=2933271 RepID=UPI002004FC9A|nr:CAP domain-containing protein [Subsaxibacter sp. CAU 1640]MCK7591129.1 CAP domain-containing protein [Subsaxibacter sp. CAU 1640]
MKTIKLLSAMALIAVLSFSCSTEEMPDETIDTNILASTPETKTIEIEILELINNHRIEIGLNPLNNLSIIKSVAFTHTDYMVEINQVNHDNFFQRKNSLIQNAGAAKVSENVAYGYSSAQSVVNAWLNSDSHRANLEGDFTDFDISAEQNNEGRWFYTNIFIKK